jgi:hypothetical protein
LMVLMQNSRPANQKLRNANAGILQAATYGAVGRLYATTTSKANQKAKSDSRGSSGPAITAEKLSNVELIFDESTELNGEEARLKLAVHHDTLLSRVRPDVKYGFS